MCLREEGGGLDLDNTEGRDKNHPIRVENRRTLKAVRAKGL